ncbi:MAG: ASKHA domain-containing protein, partial [Methanomassiliicoccales archaeon]
MDNAVNGLKIFVKGLGYAMPLVQINQEKTEINLRTDQGATLLDGLRTTEVLLPGECGGTGTCGKCRVKVEGLVSELSPAEKGVLSTNEIAAGWRLACYVQIIGDCKVYLPASNSQEENTQVAESLAVKYLAVDLGSTTIAVGLVDSQGQIIEQLQADNPQIIYGSDVLTRLSFALKSDENRLLLRQIVINTLNRLLDRLNLTGIDLICVVGNPAMVHLLEGADIKGLATYPYQGAIKGAIWQTAEDLGLTSMGHTSVYLPPAAGLYVGSDALVGAMSLWPKDNFLLVDLGTNAEVVARAGEQWVAVSAAAGPALEGACIYQGMRAQPGAITDANWLEESLELRVISRETPRGICGTGLVQVIALLREKEVIDFNGMINESASVPIKIRRGRQGLEVVLYEDQAYSVVITQEDIRQFQLAKAAVRVAIDTLISQMPGHKWQTIYLAGALG